MRKTAINKMYQHATAIAGPIPKVLHTLPEAVKLGRVRIVKKSNIVIIL